jgi:hypothetical protein
MAFMSLNKYAKVHHSLFFFSGFLSAIQKSMPDARQESKKKNWYGL